MYVEERLNKILASLEKDGQIDVGALAETFRISKETIRRDLNKLEKDGKLIRTHGGAIAAAGSANEAVHATELPANIRSTIHMAEKKLIGKAAASYVREGDVIFIDNSTTCIYVYPYIPQNLHITILTNSLQFLIESIPIASPLHTFVCLGGIMKPSNLSIYGHATLRNAQEYFPSKAFISCTGIFSENKIADMGVQEIDVKRSLMETSQEVFLLADHSKFKPAGQIFLAGLDDIDHIITDGAADFTYLNLSRENRDKIMIVNRE